MPYSKPKKYNVGNRPNPRRAELLRFGCIVNHPSTNERRARGLIGSHAYTAPRA